MNELERKRAANLWEPFARKFPPVAKSCTFTAVPTVTFGEVGGLEDAKDELLTYACAATEPEIYERWGTFAPSGLLLIGPAASGKSLLAEALATRTETPFLRVGVARLMLQLIHAGGKAGELMQGWSETLVEIKRATVYFDELDFAHDPAVGAPRIDLPFAQLSDFLTELIDTTIGVTQPLTVGSTSRPDTLSPIYFQPGRFERVVSVNPAFPGDVIDALQLHCTAAEKRAGRKLFAKLDWQRIVEQNRDASVGAWIQLMHAVLRRKARCDAASEQPGEVTTEDALAEVDRFKRATLRLPVPSGRYL
ncbi:MAG TPA: ATP-binding protein [Myxococcota bacterium]|nr:ATP-binding protein [Myxococcota bacterium]